MDNPHIVVKAEDWDAFVNRTEQSKNLTKLRELMSRPSVFDGPNSKGSNDVFR